MRISHIAIFIALFAVFSIFATHVVAQESSSSSSDSSSKTLSKLELYQQWLLQNGAQLDNIKFTKLKGHGTTVVTTSELGRGKRLALIPNSLVITKDVIEDSEVAKFFEQETLTHVAALWLLEQTHKSDSFWKPYIDILPKKLGLPSLWSDEELSELQSSPLRSITEQRKRTVQQNYHKLIGFNIESNAFPESLDWLKDVTVDEFHWALGIIWSRAFSSDQKLGTEVVLVPVEDMFVQAHPSSVESMVRVRINEGHIEFVSATNIRADSVIERFVPEARQMRNIELLNRYGIIHEHNPNDFVTVMSPYHPDLTKASTMIQILRTANCLQEEHRIYTGNDIQEILCAVRITSMNDKELGDGSLVSNALGKRMVNERTEQIALGQLQGLATNRISSYATSAEEDQAMIEADDSGIKYLAPNIKKAVIIRRDEKMIYETLLHNVELMLSNLRPATPKLGEKKTAEKDL